MRSVTHGNVAIAKRQSRYRRQLQASAHCKRDAQPAQLYNLAMLAHLCLHAPYGFGALISISPGEVAICWKVPANRLEADTQRNPVPGNAGLLRPGSLSQSLSLIFWLRVWAFFCRPSLMEWPYSGPLLVFLRAS